MSEDTSKIIQSMLTQAQETGDLARRGFGMEFAFALKEHDSFVQELLQEHNPGERLQQLIAALVWETTPNISQTNDLLSNWSSWSRVGVNWRSDKSLAGFMTTLFSPQQIPLLVARREKFATFQEMVEWSLQKDLEIRQYFRMGPRTDE